MKVFCDLKVFRRGLILFTVMTVLGVMAAEQQINHLTGRQNFVQSFNLVHSQDGQYLAYLFGEPYHVEESYAVGALSNSDKAVYLTLGTKVFIIPFIYSFQVQPSFDELYQISQAVSPALYKVTHQIDIRCQTVWAAFKQLSRQIR